MLGRTRTCLLAALLGLASACAVVVDYAKVDPPPAATCGPEAPPDCQVLPTRSFLVIYAEIDPKRLREATRARAPRSADIVIQWCVSPENRVVDAKVIDDGGAPELADELANQVLGWFSKAAVIDHQPVYACVQALFTVALTHQGARASTTVLWPNVALSLEEDRRAE